MEIDMKLRGKLINRYLRIQIDLSLIILHRTIYATLPLPIMSKAGVLTDHRERVVNHSIGKMDDTYNQHDYENEKRKAMESLEKMILEIISKDEKKLPRYMVTPEGRVRIIYNEDGVEIGTEPYERPS